MKDQIKTGVLVALIVVLSIMAYRYWRNQTAVERENTFVSEMGRALSAYSAKRNAEAETILMDLLPKSEKWWPAGPHLVENLSWLGCIERVDQKYDEARPLLERAVEVSRSQNISAPVAVGRAELNLGIMARDGLDDVAAQRLFSDAATLLSTNPIEAWGDDDNALLNLGYLAKKEGRCQDAIDYLTRSVAGYEKMFPKNPGTDVADAHAHLAEAYADVENFDAAARHYKAALDIYQQIEGPQGRDVIVFSAALENIQGSEGLNANEPMGRHRSAISENVSETDGLALNGLGWLALERGQYAEAESYLQKSCQAYEKAGGANDQGLATALESLGQFYRDNQQFDIKKAEAPLKRALEIREKIFGPEHPQTAETLSDLSLLYFYEKNAGAAEEYALRALPVEEKTYGASSLPVSTTLNRLGISERDLGKFKEAEANLKQALAIREKNHAPDRWIIISLENLASVYYVEGDMAQTQTLMARAQSIRLQSVK